MLIKGIELFRREAIEFQRQRLAGELVVKLGAPRVIAATIVAILILAYFLFLGFWHVDVHYQNACRISGSGSGKVVVIGDATKSKVISATASYTVRGGRRTVSLNLPPRRTNRGLTFDLPAGKPPIASGRHSCNVSLHERIFPGRIAFAQALHKA